MGSHTKPNQNPVLDYRSKVDDAWYTVDKLIFSKKNNSLTVRYVEFDEDDNEIFNVKDIKTTKELDEFINRFRPACVQVQDGECYRLRRGSNVCAALEKCDGDRRFYNGAIESINRKPHRRERGEERCSCRFVVGWLEGPNAWSTQEMGIDGICQLQPGSPLFDQALESFVKLSRARIGLVSNHHLT
ncbi:hypothetical protein MKW92_029107 [Papaver armeniacum]|nr:hypothetical protein MKW92_029107 [Papaver armeniacum]